MDEIDKEYVLVHSPLSGNFRRDGVTVEVLIYRGEDEKGWILEVVDSDNNSHVWDEQFATDERAMDAFFAVVNKEGMKQFNPHFRRQLH